MRAIVFTSFILAALSASAETAVIKVVCNEVETIVERQCLPGQIGYVTYTCNNKRVEKEYLCPSVPGNWGVSATTFYLNTGGSDGGPNVFGVEAEFSGHFRVVRDWMWFSILGAPGGAWSPERSYWSLTEAVSFDFHVTDWFSISVLGRHRATFDAEGGSINAIGGGLGVNFPLKFGLEIKLSSMVGTAWFPFVEETSSSAYDEKSKETTTTVTSETFTGSGLAYSVEFSLGWRFW